jgi:hypothetical protein
MLEILGKEELLASAPFIAYLYLKKPHVNYSSQKAQVLRLAALAPYE